MGEKSDNGVLALSAKPKSVFLIDNGAAGKDLAELIRRQRDRLMLPADRVGTGGMDPGIGPQTQEPG